MEPPGSPEWRDEIAEALQAGAYRPSTADEEWTAASASISSRAASRPGPTGSGTNSARSRRRAWVSEPAGRTREQHRAIRIVPGVSDILLYAISGAVRHPEYSPDTQGRMIEGAHVLVHGLRRLSALREASPAALTLRSVILGIRITGLDEMVRPRSDIQRLSQFTISNDDRDLVEAYLKPTGGLKERLAAAEMTAPFGNGDDIVEAYLNPTEGLGVHLTAAEMTTPSDSATAWAHAAPRN